MIDVYKYARENKLWKYSVIDDEKFRNFFHKIEIDTIVEIGTYRGISTAYISQFANKVYAFDIVDYPEKYKVWYDLKVSHKIFFNVVKSRYEDNIAKNFEGKFPKDKRAINIESVLDEINFDFAFIDGEHTYKDVKADFELVKRCGRVLFHDVDPVYKQVNKFAHEIGIKINGNIGYWEAEK